MVQIPAMMRSMMTADMAMPTLAASVRPCWGVKVEIGVADGEVMFVCVKEKTEPWSETVFPGVGCCSHAPSRAVATGYHISNFNGQLVTIWKALQLER
jgi:hypothetical protein